MKKILVTGATGFVGSYVVMELLQKGYDVVATSRDIKSASLKPWFKDVAFKPFDLARFDESINYFDYFSKPDILIHLAWEGLPNYKDQFHLEENLPRHLRFLKNMIHHGLRDLTVTGTCLEYGMQEGCLDESLPAQPSTPYSIAKNELRIALDRLSTELEVKFKWIRLFYMYGDGQNPKSLISQLEKALADNELMFNMSGGDQVRDFLPINKVAENIVSIALQDEINGVINCCSGVPVSVKHFVQTYLAETKRIIPLNLGYYHYPDYEPMNFWGDTKKLKLIITP